MKTKHTPAPWFAVDYAGSFCIQNGEMYEDKDILSYDSIWDEEHPFTKETVIANTKLICAAPEMLETLIKVMNLSDLWTYGGLVAEEHQEEAIALNSMKLSIEQVIKKATE